MNTEEAFESWSKSSGCEAREVLASWCLSYGRSLVKKKAQRYYFARRHPHLAEAASEMAAIEVLGKSDLDSFDHFAAVFANCFGFRLADEWRGEYGSRNNHKRDGRKQEISLWSLRLKSGDNGGREGWHRDVVDAISFNENNKERVEFEDMVSALGLSAKDRTLMWLLSLGHSFSAAGERLGISTAGVYRRARSHLWLTLLNSTNSNRLVFGCFSKRSSEPKARACLKSRGFDLGKWGLYKTFQNLVEESESPRRWWGVVATDNLTALKETPLGEEGLVRLYKAGVHVVRCSPGSKSQFEAFIPKCAKPKAYQRKLIGGAA